MTFFRLALQAEATGRWLDALTAYEQSRAAEENQLDAYTNAAFLYWHIDWDVGVQTHFLQAHQLPEGAVADFGVRWRRVLAQAIARFPNESEPYYWRRYCTEESAYANGPDPFLLALPGRWPPFELAHLYRYQHGCQGPVERAALHRLHAHYRPDVTKKGAFIANTIEAIWRFDL